MSGGKSNNQSSTDPRLTGAQAAQVEAQNKFFTGTIDPTTGVKDPGLIDFYKGAVGGAKDVYNQSAGGVKNASQNLAGVAGNAQKTLGETGESALRTGIGGLESLFNPDYEKNQIQSALAPAQAQYQKNVADQAAQFGGTGNLGSARQALADRQLAGSNASMMAKTAADVQRDVAGQRMGAAGQLAQLGQSGIGQGVGAAQTKLGASQADIDLYNKYASVIFGTPSSSYNLGPTGSTTSSSGSNLGFKI
tara:strand:- start:7 stop:753 length:747 start_codon:yes stop_codon:yes gene_type:complete